MGGYRTGLILAAPDFDTYGSLREYAKAPTRGTALSLEYLLRRVEIRCACDSAAAARNVDAMRQLYGMRLGVDMADPEKDASGTPQMDSTELYLSACRSLGMDVDLSDLMEMQKARDTENSDPAQN